MAWKLCKFGEKAEALRDSRGWTKTELCRRIGMSTSYYDYIIHGDRPGYCQRKKIIATLTDSEQDSA